jgi:hypothetical protein
VALNRAHSGKYETHTLQTMTRDFSKQKRQEFRDAEVRVSHASRYPRVVQHLVGLLAFGEDTEM